MLPKFIILSSLFLFSTVWTLRTPDWIHDEHDDGIHFRSLGRVVGSLSYSHLVMDFNIKSISTLLAGYCEFDNELPKSTPPKVRKFFKGMEAKLKQQCETLTMDFRETRNIWVNKFNERLGRSASPPPAELAVRPSSAVARPRRQVVALGLLLVGVVALGSYLFSDHQLLSLSVASGADDKTIEALQDHESRLTVNERSLGIMNRTIGELALEITKLENELHATETILRFHAGFEAIEHEVDRIQEGLHALADHRLSPSLVRTRGIANAVIRLKRKTEAQGLSLLLERVEDIFRLQTSFISFENGTVRIFVHLPAYQENTLLDLYQLVPSPIAIGGDRYLIPKPEGEILAVNAARNLFRVLQRADLGQCHRLRDVFYCDTKNFYDKRADSSCLVGLFLNNPSEIMEHCRFEVSKVEDFVVQLGPNQFLLFQSSNTNVERRCGDNLSSASFHGLREVTVDPGCQVTSRSFVFAGATSLFSEPFTITNRLGNLSTDIPLPEIRDGIEAIGAQLALVGSKDGLRIKDLVTELRNARTTSVFRFGIIVVVLVVVLVVVCLCLLRCRHFRKRYASARRSRLTEEHLPQEEHELTEQ